jgi:hypothetical protein
LVIIGLCAPLFQLRQVSQEMSEVHGKTNLGLALAKQKNPIMGPDRFASSKFGFMKNRLRRAERRRAVKTPEYGRKSVHEDI